MWAVFIYQTIHRLELFLFEAMPGPTFKIYFQDLLSQSLLSADKGNVKIPSFCHCFRRALQKLSHLCRFSFKRPSTPSFINGRFLRCREEFEDAVCPARSLSDDLAASAQINKPLAILFSDETGPEIVYCMH